jgi:23S rRNA (uracil1939-C5)-methyltransferase
VAAGSSGVTFEPAIGSLPGISTSRVVGGAIYDFSASAFFQANPFLIEALVEEAVGTKGGRLAVDLYAGVGLFTIPLARKFERVVGVESESRAASFARQNLAANGVTNTEFYTGHVEAALKDLIRTCAAASSTPDLVVLDPPRVGAAQAISRIVTLRPQRVSYVSCDPATLARDLRELVSAGYCLTRVTAFDMFPQTYHVETVAHLELR